MALHADDVSQPVGAWTRLHAHVCVFIDGMCVKGPCYCC